MSEGGAVLKRETDSGHSRENMENNQKGKITYIGTAVKMTVGFSTAAKEAKT